MTYYPAPNVVTAAMLVLGVQWAEVISTDRPPRLCRARMMITGALRIMTPLSYPEIAAVMARRHHSGSWAQFRKFMGLPIEERLLWIEAVGKQLRGR